MTTNPHATSELLKIPSFKILTNFISFQFYLSESKFVILVLQNMYSFI